MRLLFAAAHSISSATKETARVHAAGATVAVRAAVLAVDRPAVVGAAAAGRRSARPADMLGDRSAANCPARAAGPLCAQWFTIATPPLTAGPHNLPPTVVLHARIDEADQTIFVASGAGEDVALLLAAGTAVQVLDADTQAMGAPATSITWSTPARRMRPAWRQRPARCCGAAPITAVVRTTSDGELAFVERLSSQGVPVSLVGPAAVGAPPAAMMRKTLPLRAAGARPGGGQPAAAVDRKTSCATWWMA